MINKNDATIYRLAIITRKPLYEKCNLQLGLHVHTGRGTGQGHAIVKAGHREFGGTETEALGNCHGMAMAMTFGKID